MVELSDVAHDAHAELLTKFLPRPVVAVRAYISAQLYDQIVREYITAHASEYKQMLIARATKLRQSNTREPNIAAAELIVLGSRHVTIAARPIKTIIESALEDLKDTELYKSPAIRTTFARLFKKMLI